jgi:hypothetical protein
LLDSLILDRCRHAVKSGQLSMLKKHVDGGEEEKL